MLRVNRTALLSAVLFAIIASACVGNHPELDPKGQAAYKNLQVAKLTRDATTAATTANAAGKLSDGSTAAILTINKQVLDFLTEHPVGTRAQVLSIINNGRQALPPAVNADVGEYLAKVIRFLAEVN